MAYFLSIIFLFLCFASTSVNSAAGDFVFDMSNHSGFIKNSDGVFSKVSENGSVRSLSTGTSLAVQEKIPFQDSKGKSHSLTLSRTANVDTNRIGRAVTNFARKVGPIAVGFAIADAVCDLVDICSIDDVWQKTADPDLAGYPQTTDFISYYVPSFSPLFPTQDLVCAFAADFYSTPVTYNSGNNKCEGSGVALNVSQQGSCAANYTQSGNQCIADFSTENAIATDDDWTNAETALNDPQFVQPLVESTADVPSDVPVVTPGQKAALGETSKPIKDAEGNITGTEVTRRDVEVIDASTEDNPNQIIIKETETVQKLDLDNNEISSDTSTTYNQQPPQDQEQNLDVIISFDEVEFAALETHQIEQMGAVSSWGDGSCPPPIGLSLSVGQFEIDTTPVCDTAEHIKPFLLLLASIISIYIIAGYKQGA